MMVSKITEVTIFESPDGGRTVYARHPGSQHRSLHYQDPKLKQELDELEQKRRWAEIFESRHSNIALNELCSKVEVLYELSKKNK
jgi:hypothetical protein|tara:strand:+ start:1601 stop:1855 length:255 start_codon:yes stop_codon:yes gene_type:complete